MFYQHFCQIIIGFFLAFLALQVEKLSAFKTIKDARWARVKIRSKKKIIFNLKANFTEYSFEMLKPSQVHSICVVSFKI